MSDADGRPQPDGSFTDEDLRVAALLRNLDDRAAPPQEHGASTSRFGWETWASAPSDAPAPAAPAEPLEPLEAPAAWAAAAHPPVAAPVTGPPVAPAYPSAPAVAAGPAAADVTYAAPATPEAEPDVVGGPVPFAGADGGAAPPAWTGGDDEGDDEGDDDGPLPFVPADRPPRARTRAQRALDGGALVLRTGGELMMTFGVIILLFVVYELYFTGIATHRAQHQLEASSGIGSGKTPSAAPNLGDGIAEMYAPRALGASWHFIVVEGTGDDQLAKGPGHFEYDPDLAKALGVDKTEKPLADGDYPSAFPGQVGNVVISGHRTTHAHPFFNANEFEPGDAIILETTNMWYVYRVTGSTKVLPTDVSVAFPVPGQAGVTATQKLLTLTTCDPRYSATHRLIIHATLALAQPLSAGDPAALKTGKI